MSLAFAAPLAAVTPTFTPSSTVSPTMTVTPAIGEGSWSFVPDTNPMTTGDGGYSAQFSYVAGTNAWPATGGLLAVYFPEGIDAPSPSNFYAAPGFASKIGAYGYSGRTATVQVRNLAPGASIDFLFGYQPSGFAVQASTGPLDFIVNSNANDVRNIDMAGVTPGIANVPFAVISPTSTATPTTSVTPSITPTWTNSPTVTPTWTESPIGAVQTGKVYSYPNPFDMRRFDKCTFRFDPASTVQITVFNLLGEPVRELPASDINAAQGWAVWYGVDDYVRRVTGGMYFVRVRTNSSTLTKKFTVLN